MGRSHFISNLTFNEYIFYLCSPVIGMSSPFREMVVRGLFRTDLPPAPLAPPSSERHLYTNHTDGRLTHNAPRPSLSSLSNMVAGLIIHGQLLGAVQ